MEIVYIMAISLQLAGAIVLIENFWGGKLQEATIKALAGEEAKLHWCEVLEGNKTVVTYSPKETQAAATKVLRNRFAFMYIATGYVTGVIGDRGDKLIDFVAIIVVSVGLWLLCRCGTEAIAKYKFNDVLKVVSEDAPK